MLSKTRIALALAATLGAFAVLPLASWAADEGDGRPPIEEGQAGPEFGPGPGFSGPFHGRGDCRERDKPLTEAQVHDIVAGMIAWRGSDDHVGKVTTGSDGKIVAEIVDPAGKVVRRMAFDPKTGRPARAK